jgi:hypothetical protein
MEGSVKTYGNGNDDGVEVSSLQRTLCTSSLPNAYLVTYCAAAHLVFRFAVVGAREKGGNIMTPISYPQFLSSKNRNSDIYKPKIWAKQKRPATSRLATVQLAMEGDY